MPSNFRLYFVSVANYFLIIHPQFRFAFISITVQFDFLSRGSFSLFFVLLLLPPTSSSPSFLLLCILFGKRGRQWYWLVEVGCGKFSFVAKYFIVIFSAFCVCV